MAAAQGGNTQIRQMVNFILQEAHEKANEIRIKTEHDFNIEKQMLVHNAKLAIADEYKSKARAREVEERIARSTAVGDARIAKMKLRDGLLTQLIETAKGSVAAVTSTPAYPELLKKLIVQGLIKIEEKEVTVLCRSQDVPEAQKAAPHAVQEYKDIMMKETGLNVDPVVTVNTAPNKMLSDAKYCGGVVLTALHGRLVCDNTLDARVQLVYDELLPSIREQLWPIIN
ncbi:hypothetical protein CTAYLR_010800 [Chrysophaeum taylorii]|uniref:Uncharacterized protein n=1 Tax=Chrysophaeum taylorii TaxID=2483200 RepID=A0AAD7UHB9_9STRA|nr:hypothetical protein CTAYLR_010800 [Chrysophaeum taylorii]